MLHHDIIPRRSPFFALDSLMDNFFKEGYLNRRWLDSSVNIEETDSACLISVDLPGIKKEQVQMSLEDGYLVIEVNKSEEEQEGPNPRHSQKFYGRKVFQLGEGLDEENITARFADGLLSVELAKKPEQKNKRTITIA